VILSREDRAKRSIVSDSAETLLLRVLASGVGFCASVLITRALGAVGRGQYYLPVVAAGTLVAFCKLGLEQANVFLFATRGVSINRLSAQNGVVALLGGGVGVAMLLLAPPILSTLFADTPVFFMLLAGLTVPFSLHTLFSAGLLNLQGRVTWQFRAGVLAGVVQVGLLLSLLLLRWIDVAMVLGVNLITVVLTWWLTVSALNKGWRTCLRWDAALLCDTLKDSLLLHLGMVLFFLHLRVDMFMVKGMVGTAALGQYSLSVVLAETVFLVTDSLAIAILPRQVGNTLKEAASIALRTARISGLLGIGLTSLWVATGMVVIKVFFGAEFGPAYLPSVGLLPGMIFLSMQRLCGGPVLRVGRPRTITAIYGVSLFCNVALNVWLIPAWGTVGAALASSASYALGSVLFLTWTARLAAVALSEALIPRTSDALSIWRATIGSAQFLRRAYFAKKVA